MNISENINREYREFEQLIRLAGMFDQAGYFESAEAVEEWMRLQNTAANPAMRTAQNNDTAGIDALYQAVTSAHTNIAQGFNADNPQDSARQAVLYMLRQITEYLQGVSVAGRQKAQQAIQEGASRVPQAQTRRKRVVIAVDPYFVKSPDGTWAKLPNLYNLLGVPETASNDEIKAAVRKLSAKWHPDVNSTPEAQSAIRDINEAARRLLNPQFRAEYTLHKNRWAPSAGASNRTTTAPPGASGAQPGTSTNTNTGPKPPPGPKQPGPGWTDPAGGHGPYQYKPPPGQGANVPPRPAYSPPPRPPHTPPTAPSAGAAPHAPGGFHLPHLSPRAKGLGLLGLGLAGAGYAYSRMHGADAPAGAQSPESNIPGSSGPGATPHNATDVLSILQQLSQQAQSTLQGRWSVAQPFVAGALSQAIEFINGPQSQRTQQYATMGQQENDRETLTQRYLSYGARNGYNAMAQHLLQNQSPEYSSNVLNRWNTLHMQ